MPDRNTSYINCIAHESSEGNLLIGDTHSAFIDCGMAFCAAETIQKAKKALGGRPLDYIFLTHTHYDHIGALPSFRNEWPQLRTVTSAAGAEVLLKDTPRRVIAELSLVAGQAYGITAESLSDVFLDTSVFRGDVIVKDGDSICLGGLTVKVLETPGHTRDSLSFIIPELELLILSETLGVLMPDGSVYPCYLTGYADTISSIEKCRKISHRFLSVSHRGIITAEEAKGFFDKALAANTACRDFILGMKDKGLDEDQMQDLFFQQYCSEALLSFQPKEAFMTNARATIACTLREELSGP